MVISAENFEPNSCDEVDGFPEPSWYRVQVCVICVFLMLTFHRYPVEIHLPERAKKKAERSLGEIPVQFGEGGHASTLNRDLGRCVCVRAGGGAMKNESTAVAALWHCTHCCFVSLSGYPLQVLITPLCSFEASISARRCLLFVSVFFSF